MPAKTGIAALPPVDGLLVDLTGGVLSLTLNQPDTLNALSAAMVAGMADALEAAARDPLVRVVRLGGAGRGFSSGAGLSQPDGSEAPPSMDLLIDGNRAVRAIIDLPRPVVAVVHGPAAGIGVSLALACDLVIAAEEAYFLLAFTKIGLMPDGGATALVAASVGRARAMRMALLAERMPAADALAAGLISAVHPAGELAAAADELIARLLAGPAVAYGNTKLAINAATLPDLDAAIARETGGQRRLLQAADQREGIAAFLERRSPKFTDS